MVLCKDRKGEDVVPVVEPEQALVEVVAALGVDLVVRCRPAFAGMCSATVRSSADRSRSAPAGRSWSLEKLDDHELPGKRDLLAGGQVGDGVPHGASGRPARRHSPTCEVAPHGRVPVKGQRRGGDGPRAMTRPHGACPGLTHWHSAVTAPFALGNDALALSKSGAMVSATPLPSVRATDDSCPSNKRRIADAQIGRSASRGVRDGDSTCPGRIA